MKKLDKNVDIQLPDGNIAVQQPAVAPETGGHLRTQAVSPKSKGAQKLTNEEKKVLDEYLKHHNPLITSPIEASFEAHKSPKEKRNKLPAEETFDKWVYGGITYAAQAAGSVVGAMWFQHWGGKPYFEKASKWFGANVIEKITTQRGVEAQKGAHSYLIFAALIMVGNMFIPPVKYLEDRKSKIVSWINDRQNARREARGETISDEEKQQQQHAIEEIEHAPKQTWGSLFGGRAVGLVAAYLANYLVGERPIAGKKVNEHMTEFVSKTVTGGLEGMGAKKLAASENIQNASKIGTLDYVYSIVVASGIYVYSHFIAPPKHDTAQANDDAHQHAHEGHAPHTDTAEDVTIAGKSPTAEIALASTHANAAHVLSPPQEKPLLSKARQAFTERMDTQALHATAQPQGALL